ncbi:MAG: sulfatase-like hydrolase/transferase, partial [Flavobacteriaceae bacterium]
TQEALTAVRKPLIQNQPFFLYLSLYGVHTPLMADNRFINQYLEQGLPLAEARYASMIESMDKALGDVLVFVEKQKIEKETIILFMSDNGGLSAVARAGEKHTHNAPLQSGKGSIYEGGIRVPMLAYWPGVTTPNDREETPVIIEDFYPSLLEIAGVVQPETIQKVDGKSFVSLLRGENHTLKDRPLFWHYPNDWGPEGPGIGSFSAVRKGDWKLIYFHEDSHFELYHLVKDISETNNLAQHKLKIRDSLATLLTQHLMDVDAQLPFYKTTQKQIPYPSEVLN